MLTKCRINSIIQVVGASKPKEVVRISTKRIDSIDAITQLLENIHERLRSDSDNLIIVKKTSTFDKTTAFMIKHGLSHQAVCDELLRLDATNYSYTANDYDPAFGGDVYIYGQTMTPSMVASVITVYIKLKVRGKVVCLSFHEAEERLSYPYL